MNTIFKSAADAMAMAYAIAHESGRRVWRHTVFTETGASRWIISFNSDPQNALQELTA